MKIGHNSVVSFHYTLLDENGEELETTRDGNPTLALIGANNMLPGLEQAMIGKASGDQFQTTLPPVMAFGVHDENKRDRISLKYLKHEGKLRPGKIVRLNTNQGQKTGTIIKVGKFNADVDLNHPLADQTVTFDVEIKDVRAASPDEITHGHAHGVGGHEHH